MITATRRFEFACAHRLPCHEGLCNKLHGHNYVLDVTVHGDLKKNGPEWGMIVDFSKLKDSVNEVLKEFDHSFLNDLFDNPTAENLVRYLAKKITHNLPEYVILHKLRLYETTNCYVEWTK